MTDDMWIMPDNDELAFKDPERGPSNVIFKWDLNEAAASGVCYDKGDAWMQQEVSVLEDDCASIAGDNAITNWYVIEGFEVSYHTDYYGETDCDVSHTKFRRATFKDFNDIWYGGNGPWYVKLAAKLKMPAWWPEP